MEETAIYFHSEEIDFAPKDPAALVKWIKRTIEEELKETGEINFVFCTDEYLLPLNQKYLNHDTYTDIITFDYVQDTVISGDIFISVERVKENAVQQDIAFEEELDRVIIHGVLHLLGYKDKTSGEARKIRAKEDFYLTLRS